MFGIAAAVPIYPSIDHSRVVTVRDCMLYQNLRYYLSIVSVSVD